MDDQRDYEEEEYNRSEMRREGYAELRAEHNHGYVIGSNGLKHALECFDCHDEEECEDYDCLWCVPG